MLAENLIRHLNWVQLSPDPFPPAYIAFNVAPGPKSRDADVENNFDGESSATGQLVETAIDRALVFGTGCDISPIAMTVITATSGSGGKTGHLKDFLGPIALDYRLDVPPGQDDQACCD